MNSSSPEDAPELGDDQGALAEELPSQVRASPIFHGLSDEHLGALVGIARRRRFAEGAILLEEGSEGERCYLLVRGTLEIALSQRGQAYQVLATLKPGDLCGELAMVDGHVRSATCRAVSPVEVLELDRARMHALFKQQTELGYRVMFNLSRLLARRIRQTNRKLKTTLSDLLYY